MLNNPEATTPPASNGTSGDNHAGRIRVGERNFQVVLASGPPLAGQTDDICRFEIDGVTLAVRVDNTPDHASDKARDIAARLTARELQVAVLVAQGYATKNIAYHLKISEWTVGTYLRRVFAKLNVDSRAAMVYHCAPLIEARFDCPRRGAGIAGPAAGRN
jgi:DNA-binding CsgD family transcriptional regulator